MQNWIAIIISSASLILSLVAFFRGNAREKKESTINAFSRLQQNTLNGYNNFFTKVNKFNGEVVVGENGIKPGSPEWTEVTGYLSAIDHFAVGVNTNIYDSKVVNRVCGGYLCKVYKELAQVIKKKQEDNIADGSHYGEFARLVRKLEKRKNR